MNDILILYESHTGFTRRYAQWLGQSLQAPVFPWRDCRREQLASAGLVIFGGSVYGSDINGWRQFQKKWKKCGQPPILCFATGIRPDTPRTMDLLRLNNFPKNQIPLFYFRGGINPDQLAPRDKTLLRCYRSMLRRRGLAPEEEEVLRLLETPRDYTDPERIKPLVMAVSAGHWT